MFFSQISREENESLIGMFPEKEIKEAIWDCDGDKNP